MREYWRFEIQLHFTVTYLVASGTNVQSYPWRTLVTASLMPVLSNCEEETEELPERSCCGGCCCGGATAALGTPSAGVLEWGAAVGTEPFDEGNPLDIIVGSVFFTPCDVLLWRVPRNARRQKWRRRFLVPDRNRDEWAANSTNDRPTTWPCVQLEQRGSVGGISRSDTSDRERVSKSAFRGPIQGHIARTYDSPAFFLAACAQVVFLRARATCSGETSASVFRFQDVRMRWTRPMVACQDRLSTHHWLAWFAARRIVGFCEDSSGSVCACVRVCVYGTLALKFPRISALFFGFWRPRNSDLQVLPPVSHSSHHPVAQFVVLDVGKNIGTLWFFRKTIPVCYVDV